MTRWRRRGAVLVLAWLSVLVAGGLLRFDPHPWRTLLVCAGAVALAGLHADSASDLPPPWHREHRDREDWPARDARTAFYTRLLDSHLTGRGGDPLLRDRLVHLARETHRTRHGTELDSPELRSLASEPPSQLTKQELGRRIAWIEEL